MAAAAGLTNGEPLRQRWKYLDHFLSQSTPSSDEQGYEPGPQQISTLESKKTLVIGAGGLGCEILKNLALSGFKDIHVIDMDTIDVSNLNRQFLFRAADVGKSKAECAAAFVMKRVPGVRITPYNGKIQDKGAEYYMQFSIIVCGLDAIEPRRWINNMLVNLLDMSNPDSLIPLIDGGTEGFKGQSRVILPTLTSCIECMLPMHAPRAAVPLCTLASIPRQPQHCIEWAHIIAWEEQRKGDVLDMDDPEHVSWLYSKALVRAKEYGIEGVTYSMTQGVVKNIIPAIASTNAIIAASCTNEAFKIATGAAPFLNNYMMYTGDSDSSGLYTYTFQVEKKEDCPVCNENEIAKPMTIDSNITLQEFLDGLAENAETQLKRPAIRTEAKSLYFRQPAGLEEATRPNLSKKMNELVETGEQVAITDPAFTFTLRYDLTFR